ncbi:hypothetical protein AAFC00_004856 [Neodothiora populina]|uniref:Cell wall biogenesis protein Mhp1 n=1 Tax=Neodothiora populina TaxID=2781224 RepID=A0ABR3P3R1_9PEZI
MYSEKSTHQKTEQLQPHTSPGLATDVRPPISTHGHGARPPPATKEAKSANQQDVKSLAAQASTPSSSQAAAVSASITPATPTPSNEQSPAQKTPTRRPGLLNRNSSNQNPNGDRSSRRGSWISNLSSKFSSQPPPSPSTPQTSRSSVNGVNAGPSAQSAKDVLPLAARPKDTSDRETEELQPYVPQKPKETNSSFFSNLTRRLSSGQANASGKMYENGGVCPRRVLNVDKNRERCLVPELDLAKLRRVAFSVDVEIAGGPRYKDEGPTASKQQKNRDRKVKERAEGEALKHPEIVKEKADATDGAPDDVVAGSDQPSPLESPPAVDGKAESPDEKPGKKPKTEEERREKEERKRRKAEENGVVPVELARESPSSPPVDVRPTTPASGTATPRTQDRPTTDPVRIYRRCCQLRESPILKRITEQLMSPSCIMPDDPGVVAELRLSGSRMQLADVFSLGDWLAIVPVKRLLLEDADLSDEGVRVILAGLLAAKKPDYFKRRNGARHGQASSGIIEKLTLKNNPRITKAGWKYISLFLYMCRSIKAVDVSMIQFPANSPSISNETPVKVFNGRTKTTQDDIDASQTLCKALSERKGGSQLEELTMAECGLTAAQIRKVVDGAVVSGISRLGFAGNNLDDEGFDHVLHYVRSGVCHALDLGSNDLRHRLGLLAAALTSRPDCPVWGLSLAGCNLSTASLEELFPSLIALRDFRFLDLSHNAGLFDGSARALKLLRRNLPKLTNIKRIHLRDVGLDVKQTISLAEVVPEVENLAHLTLLENPQITALAAATDERSQEEACALYASLTAAARISKSIVCIDIEVPSPENGDVVKALAKQVVAYCLRNMDRTMSQTLTGPLAASLSKPHGVDDARLVAVPDVLIHLVGNLENDPNVEDDGEVGPEQDYIVGGNGLVKALQYFLSEETIDLRRGSVTASGTTTPRLNQEQAGHDIRRKGKAKEVSKELLESARKIRNRLQPALVKELTNGDEIQYRRLMFLDDTLKGIIQRFEDEYPETRITPPGSLLLRQNDLLLEAPSLSSSVESSTANFAPLSITPDNESSSDSVSTTTPLSAVNESLMTTHPFYDSDDEMNRPTSRLGGAAAANLPSSRKNSDVSLASRALSLEEGRIHRIGQKVRQDLVTKSSSLSTPAKPLDASAWAEGSRMSEMINTMTETSGPELREILERGGWEEVMERLGANLEEIRQLQMKDPVGWEQFKESQIKALKNREIGISGGGVGGVAGGNAPLRGFEHLQGTGISDGSAIE